MPNDRDMIGLEAGSRDGTIRLSDQADAIRIDGLRLSVPVPTTDHAGVKPEVDGVRLTMSNDGLRVALSFASDLVSTVSRTRIDEFLAAMEENPRLRPVQWYYASLFRVAGLRDELAISGELIDGGVEIRARFAQGESGNLLRQLRDRARGLATVTVRLRFVADAGLLRLHVELSPDVNGTLAKLVLNGISARPGITRIDDSTVASDLAKVVDADPTSPVRLIGRVQRVDVSPERAVVEIG